MKFVIFKERFFTDTHFMNEMFENCKDKKLELEEGGFYIISIKENKLYLDHEFHNYNEFNKIFYKR